MLRSLILILLTFLFIFVQSVAGPNIKSVAITDFTTNGFSADQSWIGESCVNVIIDRISSDRSIRIVERAQLNRIIEELKLQMGGLVNSDAVVETGNLIGVTYFITGSISKFENQIILSSRSFSVETGEIISSNNIKGSLENLFNLQEELAGRICGDLMIKIQVEGNINKPLENFELYQKIEYLKKMAATLPKYNLDPRRKIRTNEYLNSIQQSDELIRINPDFYLPHYYKGLFAMHLEEYDIAKKETQLAVELASGNSEPLLLRALVLSNSGETAEARQILNILTSKFPDRPEGWFLLSKIESDENENAKACESLIKSLLGKYILPQALKNLRSNLSISVPKPDEFSSVNLFNIASIFSMFWSRQKETGATLQMARNVNQEFPDFFLPYFFISHYEMEEKLYQQAVESLQICLSFYPDFPEAHRDIAICYFALKQCDNAELHVKLYLRFSDAVTDYSVLENARKKCQ